MPRHPALVVLSRDHHDALTLAFRLHHPAPPHPVTAVTPASTVADRVQWTLDRFARSLAPHFAAEEQVVFPLYEAHLPPDAPARALLARLRAEHGRLRTLRDALATPADDAAAAATLVTFADLLEAHVRAEERALFAFATDWLPAAALDGLAAAVDAALAAARGATAGR